MSSTLFKKFATDKKAESEGILYEVPGLFRCRLARLGGENKKYTKRLNELMKPYRRVAKEDLDEKIQRDINLTVFCETVILPNTWQTWRDEQWVNGIENENGDIVPATSENYKKVFTVLTDLLLALVSEAADANLYRQEALEAEAKNS